MKKYVILVTILVVTCLIGITLSRAQLQTKRDNISPDVKEKIQQLSSPDPAKRASAACALQKMGSHAEPAIPALIALLNDGTRVAPELVCYREYFSEKGLDPQFEGLREPSPGEAAVQALVALGEPSVEPLIGALKDSQWRTRKNAARALLHLRDARALHPLLAALKDDAWQVRANAAMALGEQRGEEIAEPLIVALKDSNAAVRWSAAIALGLIGDTRAVEPLIAAMKDEYQQTRMFATISLGLIRDTRAVPALIEGLKNGDGQVRMHAAMALGLIRDTRAVPPLKNALNDENAQVRKYAQMSLEQIRP
jgi:HEAT repeat protein